MFVTACLVVRSRPGRGDRARGLPPGARRNIGVRRGAGPAAWSPTRCCRSRRSSPPPTSAGISDGGTERPPRRWAPRDPLHEQCIAPGRALSVHPTGLAFHHGGTHRSPDGGHDGGSEDIAVRVLSAISFPEVWPGWRGNALIGDFHRDFLQPGCPVLTCLTVVTGRRGGGREGVPQVRPRHPAGRHRDRALPPGPAREGQRLADGDRTPQGRREAGARLLHGRCLRPARRPRRGRAGGARDLPRPGLAGERRALHAAPLLAGVPCPWRPPAVSTPTSNAWAA